MATLNKLLLCRRHQRSLQRDRCLTQSSLTDSSEGSGQDVIRPAVKGRAESFVVASGGFIKPTDAAADGPQKYHTCPTLGGENLMTVANDQPFQIKSVSSRKGMKLKSLSLQEKDHGVETFIIKREEPLYIRRRGPRFSRSRLWSEDERSNNTISQTRSRRLLTQLAIVIGCCGQTRMQRIQKDLEYLQMKSVEVYGIHGTARSQKTGRKGLPL
ncbi:hypothetical protein GWK47_023727 [Chionoecetes opilio]|uniref:Uncharacterized protein n=1 Tax=Chionoecetes opilio TaxID=41210 RepID=A0A8J4XLY0_CHIOP|nr:hypothetical protein GWK47_023727 [Chionoecetes opilio]